ncbi:hypothetical protein HJC23_000331 [Cyclotella cryptica]|uniref:Uncharacterized protein n=1 Tax=Cyclotella cryptica TaxID=29204 RepID=A0ABD3NLA0_9STRA|eukprot:CCRYP_020855-RA/>CCRYP_020855-RA protein AED:0.21 eAED:0.21 QI:194/1/1/1/1/1/2/122/266
MGKGKDSDDEESYDDEEEDEHSDEEEGYMPEEKKAIKATGSTKLAPVKNNTFLEVVAGAVAAASVATSVGAMIISPVNVVYAAGGLSCFIGPYAFFQQRRLTDVIALQETHQALSAEVDRLGRENERLREAVDKLSETVDRLEDVEQALDVITQTQGQSIEALEEQVNDNREILSKMQSNLKANVLQNLLQVVIRSDKDDNMTIEDHEIGGLITRIQGINGVEVHEDRFREAISKAGGSLQCVMDIIKNLMGDNISEESEIFTIKE